MINIKFRGKSIESGKFVFGYYVFDEEWAKHYIYRVEKLSERSFYQLIRHEVEESSVDQSMNVRDSNGQEIFGSDVIEWVDTNGVVHKQVISFNILNGCWCIGKLSWENFVKSVDIVKDLKLKVIGQMGNNGVVHE